MSKLFISYGSSVRKQADKLREYLEGKGIACWIAPRDVSTGNYAGEITRALKAADIMLIVCSKESCKSEHVKNEVSIAFGQKKHIIPYCLEEDPFDDDMEYFLSSKQRIMTTGDKQKDFALIEKCICDFRGHDTVQTAEPQSEPRKKGKPWVLVALAIAAAVVLAAVLILKQKPSDNPAPENSEALSPALAQQSPDAEPIEIVEPKKPAPRAESPSAPNANASLQNTSGTFTGKISDGYPDGYGTFTFKTRRLIDTHDPEKRFAEPGDYVKGNWTQGHLNYGEWYSAEGTKKAFIQLGDHPDTDPDKLLGTCERP